MVVALAIGAGLGLGIFALARGLGMDADRSFYPTILVVIASYYVLFAVIGANGTALVFEIGVALAFALIALVGLRKGAMIATIGIALHGGYDLVHSQMLSSNGAPEWWPAFCGAIDLVLAAAILIIGRRNRESTRHA
jgi:hypothetical protein